ncbi:MAG TPA: hypothetical protein PLL75_06865 [Candidatus Omnitrophota bacterium]|nr:hypothetical protein [Candidatus Omnitrophota bacterium]HPS37427.1 hypothetical protein [Candidatus Omnitrophota bacterium]
MRKKEIIELGVVVVTALLLVSATGSLVKKINAAKRVLPLPAPNVAASVSFQGGTVSVPSLVKRKPVLDDSFFGRFNGVTDALSVERDPFVGGQIGPRDPRSMLVLEGILWGDKIPTAVINQTFLKEGDTLNGFQVVKIQPDSVKLKDKTSEFELHLK